MMLLSDRTGPPEPVRTDWGTPHQRRGETHESTIHVGIMSLVEAPKLLDQEYRVGHGVRIDLAGLGHRSVVRGHGLEIAQDCQRGRRVDRIGEGDLG